MHSYYRGKVTRIYTIEKSAYKSANDYANLILSPS